MKRKNNAARADSSVPPIAKRFSDAGRDLAGAANAARADSTAGSPCTTRWLVCMLGEMDPSYFADEIPERDIQMAGTAWSEMSAGRGLADAADAARAESDSVPPVEKRLPVDGRDQAGAANAARSHSNWKLVAAVSGFTAACSAAVTGILVCVCMRHFHSFDGV